MTFRDIGLRFDAEDQPVEAARAYEQAITASEADLDTYINLALLYSVSNDFGYAAQHHLPQSFVTVAWDRMFEVLDAAEQRFGPHPEVTFWKEYIPFIWLGQPLSSEECAELTRSGQTRVPFLYLFGFAPNAEDRARYANGAAELLQEVHQGRTTKERYIRSVLEAAFQRWRISDQ